MNEQTESRSLLPCPFFTLKNLKALEEIRREFGRADGLWQAAKVARESIPSHVGSSAALAAKVEALRGLKQNWDSYGSEPISDKTVDAAKRVASTLTDEWTVVPVAGGSIMFGWPADDFTIEVHASDETAVAQAPLVRSDKDEAVKRALVMAYDAAKCGGLCGQPECREECAPAAQTQNQWARETAAHLAVMEAGRARYVCKYSGDSYIKFSAYHHACCHFEKELAYWRCRVAKDVEPWFDGSAFSDATSTRK